MSQLPHDPALTPSVDPTVSLIPPVNASSSYFDGISPLADFTFPVVGGFNCFCTDIVYLHMDLNHRVLQSECYRYHLKLKVLFLQIHFTGQFLPWHRWYLHAFEESLKNKCGYTGVSPYWNWTIGHPRFLLLAVMILMTA